MDVIREEHGEKTSELSQWLEEAKVKKRETNREKQDSKPKSTKINSTKVQNAGQGNYPDNNYPSAKAPPSCLCGPPGTHDCVAQCPVYIQAPTIEAKWKLLTEHRQSCYRCLVLGHKANRCSLGACGINGCKKRHHPSLHYERPSSAQRQTAQQTRLEPQGPAWPKINATYTLPLAPPVQSAPGTNMQAPPFLPGPQVDQTRKPDGPAS